MILGVFSHGRGGAKPSSIAGTQLFGHFRHVLRIGRIGIVGASHLPAFYGCRIVKARNSEENYQCLKDVLCACTADR
jgi:hypothetical protein